MGVQARCVPVFLFLRNPGKLHRDHRPSKQGQETYKKNSSDGLSKPLRLSPTHPDASRTPRVLSCINTCWQVAPRQRRMWLLQAGALLAYGSPTPARARTARMAATADAPFWFDPCLEFGLDEPRPDAGTLPLLLVLPGADGSGITAWMQFPSLAQEYAVRALCVPAGDRSSHADLVALVSQEVRSVGEGRELFLLGESMGSGVAIDVALDVPQELSGLLLVSPATGWHRKLGYRILTWRDSVLVSNRGPWPALLQLVLTLSSYELLDAAQVSLPRLHLGRTSATPRPHLGRTSAAPRPHLGRTSAAPRL